MGDFNIDMLVENYYSKKVKKSNGGNRNETVY